MAGKSTDYSTELDRQQKLLKTLPLHGPWPALAAACAPQFLVHAALFAGFARRIVSI